MRRYRRNNPINKTIGITFLLLMLALSIIGYSYSHWTKTITIQGTITTGTWEEKIACVRINKMLNGSFTDPYTGNDTSIPTNLIHVGTNTNPGWPTKFQMVITVKNCGTINTTNIVADIILDPVEPINYTASKGTVDWYKNITHPKGEFVKNFFNWTIGILAPCEEATLEIWIQTLRNPQNKYEPTSENQPLYINPGATVTAISELGTLTATTENITLTIVDADVPDDPNIAVITPTLPYFTPWAEAKIPP
jgi:hypothetical protein